MSDELCTVEGCKRPRYQQRRMCSTHVMRMHRYGSTEPPRRVPRYIDITGKRYGTLVAVERIGLEWRCVCDCGGERLARYWNLEASGESNTCGDKEEHLEYSNTYIAVHQRVRRRRGLARDHLCIDCGRAAAHWSYDHTDPAEMNDPEHGPYSPDLDRYHPRCVPCHKRFDLDRIEAA